MGPRSLVVVAVAGCDQLFDVRGVASLDGPSPFVGCATQHPTPWFCADFDEPGPIVYESGLASQLPITPTGVTAIARAPDTSPPNALWIDSQSATYSIDVPGAELGLDDVQVTATR